MELKRKQEEEERKKREQEERRLQVTSALYVTFCIVLHVHPSAGSKMKLPIGENFLARNVS